MDPADVGVWVKSQTLDDRVRVEVGRLMAVLPTIAGASSESGIGKSQNSGLGDLLLGKTLGGFRLERMIGSGGMGRVYSSVETTPPEGKPPRRAAVKVMGRSVATGVGLKRFEQEVSILAGLSHPRIARLYESGLWDDGTGAVPWYAMEYIESARDLVTFCEEERVPPKARLRLVAEVADAIAHAHAKGVVHRDLKPANILVGMDGHPRVIDFGIARAEESIYSAGVRTETGQLVGTLQYMSPEQFRADPRAIDRRVDVYALGVITYELVSALYPHDIGGLPVHEAARIVIEKDPTPIRGVVTDLDPRLAAAIMKAIARDPMNRFDGASEFASAIRRALESSPASTVRNKSETKGKTLSVQSGKVVEEKGLSWIMVAAFSAVVVGGALFFVFGRGVFSRGSAAPTTLTPTPTPSDSGPVRNEHALLKSVPPGAAVLYAGQLIGTTPFEFTFHWDKGSTAAVLTFTLDGHKTIQQVIAPDPDGGRSDPYIVTVELVPTP